MFNIEKIHMILDEIICNGYIVETSQKRILEPIKVQDKVQNNA